MSRRKPKASHLAPVVSLSQVELTQNARTLRELMRQEAAGELAGLIVVAMSNPGERAKAYELYTTGVADCDYTLAVGAVASCQALLQRLALEDAGLL